jgi:hypothetical protein
MKKSINNLSFDQIFAERGKEVKVNELEKGRVYLFDQTGQYFYNWIAKFSGINENPDAAIGFSESLASDGWWDENVADGDGIRVTDASFIFEATQNQVELLNSYINEL